MTLYIFDEKNGRLWFPEVLSLGLNRQVLTILVTCFTEGRVLEVEYSVTYEAGPPSFTE